MRSTKFSNLFTCRVAPTFATTLAVILSVMLNGSPASALLSAESHPQFEKKKIKIGTKIVTVEIADTDEKREYGLMFREKLPEDEGMLFVFDEEQSLSFWMKNTLIPLSIGYFDSQKSLLETHEMTPPVIGELKMRTYPSRRPALYALEMSPNWFHRNSIRLRTVFTFVGKP